MSTFGTNPVILPMAKFDTATVAPAQPGVQAVSTDGKKYRLVKAAEAILAGQVAQSPAIVADFENLLTAAPATDLTKTAFVAGEDVIVVTLGATAVAADELAGDTIVVNAGDGTGYSYVIKGNSIGLAAGKVTLRLEESIVADLTIATAAVSIIKNKYNGVILAPVAITGPVAGVAVRDIAVDSFGWVQTAGVASVLADGATPAGDEVFQSDGVAGAAKTALTANRLGVAYQTLVTAEYRAVNLEIE